MGVNPSAEEVAAGAAIFTAIIALWVLVLDRLARRRQHIDQLGVYAKEKPTGSDKFTIYVKNSSGLPFHSVAIWIKDPDAPSGDTRKWQGAAPSLSLAPNKTEEVEPALRNIQRFCEGPYVLTAIARDNAGRWWRDKGFGWKRLRGWRDKELVSYWVSAKKRDESGDVPDSRLFWRRRDVF